MSLEGNMLLVIDDDKFNRMSYRVSKNVLNSANVGSSFVPFNDSSQCFIVSAFSLRASMNTTKASHSFVSTPHMLSADMVPFNVSSMLRIDSAELLAIGGMSMNEVRSLLTVLRVFSYLSLNICQAAA